MGDCGELMNEWERSGMKKVSSQIFLLIFFFNFNFFLNLFPISIRMCQNFSHYCINTCENMKIGLKV